MKSKREIKNLISRINKRLAENESKQQDLKDPAYLVRNLKRLNQEKRELETQKDELINELNEYETTTQNSNTLN